jgi:hypothetical protein
VQSGADARLPKDPETGVNAHTFPVVYRHMLLTVVREYHGAPDLRTLGDADIRFLYDGLRPDLRKYSKSK